MITAFITAHKPTRPWHFAPSAFGQYAYDFNPAGVQFPETLARFIAPSDADEKTLMLMAWAFESGELHGTRQGRSSLQHEIKQLLER